MSDSSETGAPPPWRDPSRSLGERCVAWAKNELAHGVRDAKPGVPAGPRIQGYLAGCVRRATGEPLNLKEGNWCAASACAAAEASVLRGETIPHGYRAAVIELQQDAEVNGSFRPVGAGGSLGAYRPQVGDLAIFHRGDASSWEGHVSRVVTPPDAAGRFQTIGGNEGADGAWHLTWRSLHEDELRGFIAYPALAARAEIAPEEHRAVPVPPSPARVDPVPQPVVPPPSPVVPAAPAEQGRARTVGNDVLGHLAEAGEALKELGSVLPSSPPKNVADVERMAAEAAKALAQSTVAKSAAVALAAGAVAEVAKAVAPDAPSPSPQAAEESAGTDSDLPVSPEAAADDAPDDDAVEAAPDAPDAPEASGVAADVPAIPAAVSPRPPGARWAAPVLIVLTAAAGAVGLVPGLPGPAVWMLEMALLSAFVAVIGRATLGTVFGALISPEKLMSLSRFQTLLWSGLILSAYLAIVLRRMDAPDPLALAIDWRLWTLMGISTSSLVGTPLLQLMKKAQEPQKGVTAATSSALGQPEEEITTHARGLLYANPSPSDARFTDMFEGDELGNAQFVDLSKVQMFFFTMVAALAYGVALFKLLKGVPATEITALPALSPGLLAVLGLSHAGYLGATVTRQTPTSADAPLGGPSAGPTSAEAAVSSLVESSNRAIETVKSLERASAAQMRSTRQLSDVLSSFAERGSQQDGRSQRDLSSALDRLSQTLESAQQAQRLQHRGADQLLAAAQRLEDSARAQEEASRQVSRSTERLRRRL